MASPWDIGADRAFLSDWMLVKVPRLAKHVGNKARQMGLYKQKKHPLAL